MFVKTFCLLLVLAVVAYGLPNGYGHLRGGNVERHQNQGGSGSGFGNSNGQGGLPNHDSLLYGGSGSGFGKNNGQGGLPNHDSLHYR